MNVLRGAREPQTAGRRVPVGGIAQDERSADPQLRRDHAHEFPSRHDVDLDGMVSDAEGFPRVRLDLRVVQCARVLECVVQMEDPLL